MNTCEKVVLRACARARVRACARVCRGMMCAEARDVCTHFRADQSNANTTPVPRRKKAKERRTLGFGVSEEASMRRSVVWSEYLVVF